MGTNKNVSPTQEQKQAREVTISQLSKQMEEAVKEKVRTFIIEGLDKVSAKSTHGGFAPIENRIPQISLNEVPIAYFGDIVAVKGLSKVGKSHFAALLMAACLSERPIGGKVYVQNELSMLIFDTEQSDGSIAARHNNGLRTAGVDSSPTKFGDVAYIHLREYDHKERRQKLFEIVDTIQPNIVYIDGVRQFMAAANDEAESSEVIEMLKKLTGNGQRIVFVVLHTNPTDEGADKDKKMRGHIGTLLDQTAQSVLSLSRKKEGDKNVFKIETSVSRDDNDTQVCFEIVGAKGEGRYVIKRDPEIEEKETIFADVYRELERTKEPATKGSLVKVLLAMNNPKTGKPFGNTAAYNLVERAMKLHVLEYHDGLYYLAHHA